MSAYRSKVLVAERCLLAKVAYWLKVHVGHRCLRSTGACRLKVPAAQRRLRPKAHPVSISSCLTSLRSLETLQKYIPSEFVAFEALFNVDNLVMLFVCCF